MDQDATSGCPATVTVKVSYCPGSSLEEIRRFNFPLPDGDSQCQQQLYDELRRRIAAVCCSADPSGAGEVALSLYYVDADQERVRFSTSEELAQLLRLHHESGRGADAPATLRILAEPDPQSDACGGGADGAEHQGVRCNGCNQSVRGRRFKCFVCPDYDLCQKCILRGLHDQHSMLVLHRPGDAESLPPWLSRGFGRGGFGWMWGRHSPWQQQQQQQQQPQPPPPLQQQQHPMFGCQQQQAQFARSSPLGGPFFNRMHMPPHMPMPPMPMPPPPPLPVACPKLAKKMEKARHKFEAKMAKRCERMQRKWTRKHEWHQQQQEGSASASGTADEPIRIDIDEQQQRKEQPQQQQQQQQQQLQHHLSPEEALLLKQLKKRHRQSASAGAAAVGNKKKKRHHYHHHKRGHGGRKRRRSFSSSSSSGSSSDSGSGGSSSSSGSSSDSDSDAKAGDQQQQGYRQLLKKFKKMGFKDDETCWLRELIREKRGNLNEILDAIRQRKEAGRDV